MSNEHLDRAIGVAQERVFNNQERVVDPLDRTYARALVAELLRGMDKEDADPCCQWSIGWGQALAEIRRRAGIVEGEG